MRRFAVAALVGHFLGVSALASIQPYPANFRTDNILSNGAQIYVRVGGKGAAIVLLHGYGETGDMWSPLAVRLARDHTVIVPDLRGLGLSSRPAGGYDKKTQAADLAGVLDALKIEKVDLVTHDIGRTRGQIRPHRCAASRNRSMGRYHPQPRALAFLVLWTGCRTSGERPRANLSRSFLERIFSRSQEIR
jgi:hypothetical protein